MMKSTLFFALAACIGSAAAHSWLDLPPARFPYVDTSNSSADYCIRYDDGSLVYDKNGKIVCGNDAQALNMLVLRPNTWRENPCYFNSGHTFHDIFPTGVYETESIMCAAWASNGHWQDPTRNYPAGGVRLAVTNKLTNITQDDFDKMVLATVPYEMFSGAKVMLPGADVLPPGRYTFQFMWDWISSPVDHLIFSSCADITIVPKGDARLSQQSPTYKMGLPQDYKIDAGLPFHCFPSDTLYYNSTFVTPPANINNYSFDTPTTAPVTSAPATSAPAPGASGSSNQGTATSAPTTAPTPAPAASTQAPQPAYTSSQPSGSNTAAPAPAAVAGTYASVTNSTGFAAALAARVASIVLAPGSYPAPSNGQGFIVAASNTVISAAGNVFISCSSTGDNGLVVSGSNVNIFGLTISNCASAVFVTSPSATFNGITTSNNYNNVGQGAGFHVMYGAVATIKSSNVVKNTASAAIYNYGTVNIVNSTVSSNIGGGIVSRYGGIVRVSLSAITKNQGSGIYASENSFVYAELCNISANYGAWMGGGIGLVESSANITSSILQYNSASKNGGGIYVEGASNQKFVILSESVVTDNVSPAVDDVYFQTASNPAYAPYVIVSWTTMSIETSSALGFAPDYCCDGEKTNTVTSERCCYPYVASACS